MYQIAAGSLSLNEVDAFRKARRKLSFAQFWIECNYNHLCTHVYTMESCWNLNSKTREPDWLQHDRTTVCVIANQYSSATFVSLRFHFRWGRIRHAFQKRYQFVSLNFFRNFVTLKLRMLGRGCTQNRLKPHTAVVAAWWFYSRRTPQEIQMKKALSLFPRQCTGTHSL